MVNQFSRVAMLNKRVVNAQYAVRSAVLSRSSELAKVLKSNPGSLPFQKILPCNIGNPHMVGQKPITFLRQVLSICMYPPLLEQKDLFPPDVIKRAGQYISSLSGGVGAYSNSQGIEVVRNEVAEFISKRDSVDISPSDIFLTSGASEAVNMMLQALIRSKDDGIMIPVPQYPLYSSSITLNGGSAVGYHLSEAADWSYCLDELEQQYEKATISGLCVRALVIINPCNPTGVTLQVPLMERILEFCSKHELVLLSDEVYQDNTYDPSRPFVSFHKVLHNMPDPISSVPLVCFHSISKGFTGECGLRGGYMALSHFGPEVLKQFYKIASISLCSNVIGQLAVGLSVNPPKPGDASFELYQKEKMEIKESLKRRALKIVEALNSLDGIQCANIHGAMYCFPSVDLPEGAIEEARRLGYEPDMFYCMRLLEATGVVTVPGSGFKQRKGSYHFRTTILPGDDELDDMVKRIGHFHKDFVNEFSSNPSK